MTHFRFLSVLAPRLSQFLGWTVDTTSYVDPLLKREEIPKLKKEFLRTLGQAPARLYQPPAYVPPQTKLKGNF